MTIVSAVPSASSATPDQAGDPPPGVPIRDRATQSSRSCTPPAGFGKDVNEYLNHYVTVADAKAAAVLAANVAFAIAIMQLPATVWASHGLLRFALVALSASSFVCLLGTFPRLPRGRSGRIFWEDIRAWRSLEAYVDAIDTLDERQVECEYASQNWYVSNVLHKKHVLIRLALVLSCIGLILASVGLIPGGS